MADNFFAHTTAAERYAQSRPYFHPVVIDSLRRFLHLEAPLEHALDVACGTGLSTRALKTIAGQVTATDVSSAMLTQAPREPGIEYVETPAEALPFGDEAFDLATVALAFHWFDRECFLREAYRVLRPGGWLVIYNNGFFGQMLENSAFTEWNKSYLTRYPTPPRNSKPLTEDDARSYGFHFAKREAYTNEVQFSPQQLAAYLTTQSNVIASVEQGKESIEDVYQWLLELLAPLFPVPICTFSFGGDIWYLQKVELPG